MCGMSLGRGGTWRIRLCGRNHCTINGLLYKAHAAVYLNCCWVVSGRKTLYKLTLAGWKWLPIFGEKLYLGGKLGRGSEWGRGLAPIFLFLFSCIAFQGVASWAVSCISPWQSIVKQFDYHRQQIKNIPNKPASRCASTTLRLRAIFSRTWQ
jgi:hypothetical protein